jgi:hypothetical protein
MMSQVTLARIELEDGMERLERARKDLLATLAKYSHG